MLKTNILRPVCSGPVLASACVVCHVGIALQETQQQQNKTDLSQKMAMLPVRDARRRGGENSFLGWSCRSEGQPHSVMSPFCGSVRELLGLQAETEGDTGE